MSSKRCRECGYLVDAEKDVCEFCAAKDDGTYNTLMPQPHATQRVIDNQWFGDDSFVDCVAVELKKDINYLMELGIKLEKGTLAAKTGGTAWAGYEAFTGDWLSALVVGGISLLAGCLTSGYKRIKVMEIQQKWMNQLSGLSQEQLDYLAVELGRKYPLLLRGFQNLLQAGQE